jgi:ATP/maltotriose-dependent transcriptional regulator MalT
VRAADLGFSVEEAATFLGAGMGLRLEREQLAALVESLTERELEVLRLLAARRCSAGIAAELFVDQSTVKTHLIHLYSKLGVHSRTQAVARAPRLLG